MTNNDNLALNAEQCTNILENIAGFEPDDIDGDDVDLRFDLNGMDTGCTVSIVEQCQHAADALRALLAERDADKKRIAELEDKQRETLRQARSFREAHESAAELIRRYDSKTIKLTPPTTRLWAGSIDCYEAKEILIAFRTACAAAGINLEVGE